MQPRISPRYAALVSIVFLGSLASADTLSGRVLDASMNGVPGVDIDFVDMVTGDDVDIANDGTDANGNFLVTAPAGLYRVIFFPPQPPTTTHVVTCVENVVVVGASALGDVQLTPGVSLSGRLVDGGGTPLPGINLDFVDPATGLELPIPGDSSGPTGTFLVAVPLGPLELQILPGEGNVPLYAPRLIELDLSVNTALGDLTVDPGFFLSGTVERTNGTPVSGADADVIDKTTGDKLLTPGDGSDAFGFVEVVVPAGTFDLEICPPGGSGLAGASVTTAVASNTNVGDIILVAGSVLSGQVTMASGTPVQGADVDVRDAASGIGIVTCDDNTDAGGNYSVRVPNGTYHVIFSVPSDPGVGTATVSNVIVAGATTVDGKLPGCACARYCSANPNSTGQPACLTATGDVNVNLTLTSAPVPNTTGQFFFGPMMLNGATFGDGLLCAGGMTTRILPFVNAGMMMQLPNTATISINYTAPYASGLTGTKHFQHWYRSGLSTGSGFNTSDGLSVTF